MSEISYPDPPDYDAVEVTHAVPYAINDENAERAQPSTRDFIYVAGPGIRETHGYVPDRRRREFSPIPNGLHMALVTLSGQKAPEALSDGFVARIWTGHRPDPNSVPEGYTLAFYVEIDDEVDFMLNYANTILRVPGGVKMHSAPPCSSPRKRVVLGEM